MSKSKSGRTHKICRSTSAIDRTISRPTGISSTTYEPTRQFDDTPSYMEHTVSSKGKISSRTADESKWCVDTTTQQWTDESDSHESDGEFKWPDEPTVQEPELERCDSAIGLKTYQSLAAKSRLNDALTSTFKCPVPFKIQQRLKRTADRLAREAIWNFFRRFYPDIQRRFYPEGPEQVEFGFGKLQDKWDNHGFLRGNDTISGKTMNHIWDLVMQCVSLRNAVSHPEYKDSDTITVDELLYTAQALTVGLEDTTRSLKIRNLRDQLELASTDALKKVEMRVELQARQNNQPKPWQLYFQHLFEEVNFDCSLANGDAGAKYPEAIKQAVRSWELQQRC